MSQGSTQRRLSFRFRWKYAISAFLVFGVLSLTIGGKNAPDPLLTEAQALSKQLDDLFKINKMTAAERAQGGGDPNAPLATPEELDGPGDRTFLENSPKFLPIVAKIKNLGQKISDESFRRELDVRNEVGSDAINAVAEAVKLYGDMQIRLYKNYMRLAHDAKYKTYPSTNLAKDLFTFLMRSQGVNGAAYAATRDLEKWAQNQEVQNASGARKFSPNHFDFLNIKISNQTAQNLQNDQNANKVYNLRHVKGSDGRYEAVEFFMSDYQKQMAEYEAIAEPNSKEEYMKLVQFAAISEGLANRWALRRMNGAFRDEEKAAWVLRRQSEQSTRPSVNSYSYVHVKEAPIVAPNTFTDGTINSCAPDLVSFRLPRKGTVNDLGVYSGFWQADRHTDLIKLTSDAAVASTVGNSLLSNPEYGELFATYVSGFDSFKNGALVRYAGDTETMLADITEGFAPPIKAGEEDKWSHDRIQGHEEDTSPGADGLVLAREVFFYSNLPADDLSIRAVSERYADRAFQARKYYLAQALWGVANAHQTKMNVGPTNPYEEPGASTETLVKTFPETERPEAMKRAAEVVEEFMKPREQAWKTAQAEKIRKALESKLGMDVPTANGNPAGLGYVFGQDLDRYDRYSKDLMPIAAIGARGIQAQRAGEKAEKKLEASLKAAYYCPPGQNTSSLVGGVTSTGGNCYYRFPEVKNASDPNEYLGYAPYRHIAREMGLKNIILPETPDQLSIFFRKKIDLVLSVENKETKYVEPEITERIAKNAVVMRGIDRFFGALSGAIQQAPGGGEGSACQTELASVDRPTPRKKNRNPATGSSQLSPEQCSSSENDEAEARRKALEAVIIPTAKKAYADFIKGLSDPGSFIDPVRAMKKLEETRPEREKRMADRAADKKREEAKKNSSSIANAYVPYSVQVTSERMTEKEIQRQRKLRDTPPNPTLAQKKAAELAAKKAEEDKLKNGYFRPGRDRSLDRKGGELFLATEKERKEAKELYREALAMIGIAEEVTAGVHGEEAIASWSKAKSKVGAEQVLKWVTTQHLIRQKIPKARLLERMVATVTDQIAMGKVLAQESIARAPILSLQPNWEWRKDEKMEPILLEKLAEVYSATAQWKDGKDYHRVLKNMLATATLNDQGKLEAFCSADIKNYRNNYAFKTMYGAATGVRSTLTSDGKMKAWDESVRKDVRSWQENILEDYIEPNQTLIMVAIGIVVLAQIVFTVVSGGAGAVTAPAAAAEVASLAGASGSVGAAAATAALEAWLRKGALWIAKMVFLQFTGNVGLVSLIFSFQSVLMVDLYLFKLPPQMGFTYQLANSQIQNMQNGRFAGMSLVDRERMNQARSELKGQRLGAVIAAAGEILQFGVFTRPGILRTFGVKGEEVFVRMAKSSTSKQVEIAGTKSIPELMKEKRTFREAVSEYWNKAGVAARSMERVGVVKGTKAAKETLEVMLGNRLSSELLKDRAVLKKFYTAMKSEKMKEASSCSLSGKRNSPRRSERLAIAGLRSGRLLRKRCSRKLRT